MKREYQEYIERGELESILHNRYDRLAGLRPDFYAGYMMAFHTIEDDVPTASDVVEVVRCKDCLYSTERYGHMDCIHGVSYRNTWNKPDFFCSYGERKEGAD